MPTSSSQSPPVDCVCSDSPAQSASDQGLSAKSSMSSGESWPSWLKRASEKSAQEAKKAGIAGTVYKVVQQKWRWARHVAGMSSSHVIKHALDARSRKWWAKEWKERCDKDKGMEWRRPKSGGTSRWEDSVIEGLLDSRAWLNQVTQGFIDNIPTDNLVGVSGRAYVQRRTQLMGFDWGSTLTRVDRAAWPAIVAHLANAEGRALLAESSSHINSLAEPSLRASSSDYNIDCLIEILTSYIDCADRRTAYDWKSICKGSI